MKHRIKKLVCIGISAFLLNGCSVFSSEKDVVEMAELPVFDATYQPKIAWSQNIGSGVETYFSQLQPNADENSLYVASREGLIKAFSVDTGKLKWSVDLSKIKNNRLNRSARFSGGITVADDMLLIGTENAQVFSLDKYTGDLLWLAQVRGEVLAQPAYSMGIVVIHTTRGDLTALDSLTGKELWTLSNKLPKLTLRGSSTPVIEQGAIVYGRADGFIATTLLKNGQPLWQLPVARPFGATELDRIVDVDVQPIIHNGIVYTFAYNGNLLAIDLFKGQQLWSGEYSGYNDLALSGKTLYLTDQRGYVFAVDSETGKQLWVNKKLSYRHLTGVTIANQYIVIGDAEGYLHWLDRENGHFVAQQLIDEDGLYRAPFETNNYLYLQTRSGKIVAIEKPSFNKK
ncbi:outer membrane protein assembly factor BamB [Psychromonas sp. CD1]|uniref:outer membrane protein assembly factor BamB n=1 Tax=Psychromonas sp. CD1 TaxID=1979839 RepID=UPI000B9A8774|nr:outer membrane protein assembly factor BamB [Psychromonas sp. CD1]